MKTMLLAVGTCLAMGTVGAAVQIESGLVAVAAEHLEERTSQAGTNDCPNLPEIYLIGDSIRMGYCKDVAKDWPATEFADYCHFKAPANEKLGRAVADFMKAYLPSGK